MQIELGTGSGIGQRGLLVQQQHQTRPLPQVRPCRACDHEASGLSKEIFGEVRAIAW
jgi:hypothetical protein